MRRDNKPYSVRLLINAARAFYTRWRIVPQFDSVGPALKLLAGTAGNLRARYSSGRQCAYSNRARADVTPVYMARRQRRKRHHPHWRQCVAHAGSANCVGGFCRDWRQCDGRQPRLHSDSDWHEIYDRLASPGLSPPFALRKMSGWAKAANMQGRYHWAQQRHRCGRGGDERHSGQCCGGGKSGARDTKAG